MILMSVHGIVNGRFQETLHFHICSPNSLYKEMCVARQYPLIEEHSARLRPRELFDKNGLLELWVAPGDTEMDVAYNRPTVRFQKMLRAK